jgi:hypothetical protein
MTPTSQDGIIKAEEKKGGVEMEAVTLSIKYVVFLALEVFVVGLVGVTLIAGLYQLVRDQVRSALIKVRESRVPAPAMARKSA